MEIHATDDFTEAFDYASSVTAERFQNPLWFITDRFRSSFWSAICIVRKFGDEIVATAVDEQKRLPEIKTGTCDIDELDQTSGSLIRSLFNTLSGSNKMVADAALNYLSAGRDTTAQALTWTFYFIMRHTNVRSKIMEEIYRVISEARTHDFSPSLFTTVSAPYMTAAFYEALRLYPPVPFNIKQVARDTTLPDGTFLPEKSVLVWCTWAMNRSVRTWGAESMKFDPDRWITNGKHLVNRAAHEFPVFNGGQRICLGKKMAESIAVRTIATLMYNFNFDAAFEGERVSKSSLTMPMEGGLPVRVAKR